MAGSAFSDMVVAVSEAGGLGSLDAEDSGHKRGLFYVESGIGFNELHVDKCAV